MSWSWGPYESGFAASEWLCGCMCVLGWWMLHMCVRSVSPEIAESCGIAPSATTTIPLPCAQTPLTAHGSPTTTHHDHQKSPSFQQKPTPAPQRPRPPMCNTNDNHTHNPIPELDRSRGGVRPISARSTTDLEPEANRSRRGVRPISAMGAAADLGFRTLRAFRAAPCSPLHHAPPATLTP